VTREPYRLAIRDCFVIAGRGVVVVGDIEAGVVHADDLLDLVHAGQSIRTRCLGVEMGHGRKHDGELVHFVGLLLDGVEEFTVEPGDYVSGPM